MPPRVVAQQQGNQPRFWRFPARPAGRALAGSGYRPVHAQRGGRKRAVVHTALTMGSLAYEGDRREVAAWDRLDRQVRIAPGRRYGTKQSCRDLVPHGDQGARQGEAKGDTPSRTSKVTSYHGCCCERPLSPKRTAQQELVPGQRNHRCGQQAWRAGEWRA